MLILYNNVAEMSTSHVAPGAVAAALDILFNTATCHPSVPYAVGFCVICLVCFDRFLRRAKTPPCLSSVQESQSTYMGELGEVGI